MPSMDSVFSITSDESFGILSPSFSIFSVKEQVKDKDLKKLLKLAFFEPQAKESLIGSLAASTDGDDDSLSGGRLGNTDW